MRRHEQKASARSGQHFERLLIGLVYLDPRLIGAYQANLSEIAGDLARRPPPAVDEFRVVPQQAAAGVIV